MTDRAVSTTLNYVLALGIAALLVTGLLTAGGNFVADQRDTVVREEMNVIGQQLSANIEQADRLANASDSSDPVVQVNETFPDNVGRSEYDVRLDADDEQLVLTSTNPEETVRVNVSTNADLEESRVDGGKIIVRYDNTDDELVIDDA